MRSFIHSLFFCNPFLISEIGKKIKWKEFCGTELLLLCWLVIDFWNHGIVIYQWVSARLDFCNWFELSSCSSVKSFWRHSYSYLKRCLSHWTAKPLECYLGAVALDDLLQFSLCNTQQALLLYNTVLFLRLVCRFITATFSSDVSNWIFVVVAAEKICDICNRLRIQEM